MRHQLAAVLALMFAGPALAQSDGVGMLTFEASEAGEQHSFSLDTFFVQLGSGSVAGHVGMSVTCEIEAPDPALIAWVTGPVRKRHVTLQIQDRSNSQEHSVYDLLDTEVTIMVLSYNGAGAGSQSLELAAGHMAINGQPVY